MRFPLPPLPRSWPPDYPRHRPVSGEEARSLDREAEEVHGLPSLVLMEHASRGVAALAARLAQGARRVVVACGPGNNGGDGYGAARFLASWGLPVRVLRCSARLPGSPDAACEVRWSGLQVPPEDAWERPELAPEAFGQAEVLVDALFGVGLVRDLGPPYPGWIEALNRADAIRLAVDVPSGLDADTGAARPLAVRADVTATMGLPKTGLLAPAAREAVGHLVELDIGLPGVLHRRHLLEG